jgi:hypothetical protein
MVARAAPVAETAAVGEAPIVLPASFERDGSDNTSQAYVLGQTPIVAEEPVRATDLELCILSLGVFVGREFAVGFFAGSHISPGGLRHPRPTREVLDVVANVQRRAVAATPPTTVAGVTLGVAFSALYAVAWSWLGPALAGRHLGWRDARRRAMRRGAGVLLRAFPGPARPQAALLGALGAVPLGGAGAGRRAAHAAPEAVVVK